MSINVKNGFGAYRRKRYRTVRRTALRFDDGEGGGERYRVMCGSNAKIKNMYSQSQGKNITLECKERKTFSMIEFRRI